VKYYLIVGEASGDLHASRLMAALREEDSSAEFRFVGGDRMAAVGGTMVRHYRELAYMGFVPVLLHLRTILANLARCKRDIVRWKPDVVILVDYPGFNLKVAAFVRKHTGIPVYYYISPKIWAWKEHRIRRIRRDVDKMFCILPFEVDYYQQRHQYTVYYTGNPTVDEVAAFRAENKEPLLIDAGQNEIAGRRPIIALLPGSRKQEIKDNLPKLMQAVAAFNDCQAVIAGAPGIDAAYYRRFVGRLEAKIVFGQTFALLMRSRAAVVTSGTATLETALMGVPQAVCYHMPLAPLAGFLKRHLLKVRYISLVNLIADSEVVRELVADSMTVENIRTELNRLLNDPAYEQQMREGYAEVARRLGALGAPQRTAAEMIKFLKRERPVQ
jgi:lipid-A-disaccharide synthase